MYVSVFFFFLKTGMRSKIKSGRMFKNKYSGFFNYARSHDFIGYIFQPRQIVGGICKYYIVPGSAKAQEVKYIMVNNLEFFLNPESRGRVPDKTCVYGIHFYAGDRGAAPGNKFQ